MKILLSGANFINKGAEAMLFIAANECFQRFEGATCIIQLPEGFIAVRSMEELYELSIGKSPLNSNKKKRGKIRRKLQKLKEMRNAYRQADIMLDLSGYELSSKLGVYPSWRYLYKIQLAKRYKTAVYLMPQSFGPFSYRGLWKAVLPRLIKKRLKYPKICFAREEEGFACLKEAAPQAKVVLSDDLVLQNKAIEYEMDRFQTSDLKIKKNSVGLIPNRRLIEQGSEGTAMNCFYSAVEQIRKRGKTVYLLCHAADDMSICKQIKAKFQDDSEVIIIDAVLSCFEYQRMSAQFDYVVAARYHSIVHAYKEGTPAVALGWAVKYQELLGKLNQQKYLVQVEQGAEEAVKKAIVALDIDCKEERARISACLCEIQKTVCFDQIIFEGKK